MHLFLLHIKINFVYITILAQGGIPITQLLLLYCWCYQQDEHAETIEIKEKNQFLACNST